MDCSTMPRGAGRLPPMLARVLSIALAVLTVVPTAASAQRSGGSALQWEARADATVSPRPAAHAGVGVNVRAGAYARIGVAYLAGATDVRDLATRFSQRADASVRFLLDPYAERRRGLYGGAGVTVRQDDGADWEGRLLLLVGLEGDPTRRVIPSVELALGGGVRLGIVLRGRRSGGAPMR